MKSRPYRHPRAAGAAVFAAVSWALPARIALADGGAAGDEGGAVTGRARRSHAVRRYREADAARDVGVLREVLAPGARAWFEQREGPGVPVDPESPAGPWTDWDRFFHSSTQLGELAAHDGGLRAIVTEINDWYRLVERPPSRYHVTYWFDDRDRITAILVSAVPGEPKAHDRLPEFRAWAAASRPGLLEKLMPEGKLDPSIEKARLWKSSLEEWRATLSTTQRAIAAPAAGQRR